VLILGIAAKRFLSFGRDSMQSVHGFMRAFGRAPQAKSPGMAARGLRAEERKGSGHVDGDEGQQEHQGGTDHRQNDRDGRNHRLDGILGLEVVAVVAWLVGAGHAFLVLWVQPILAGRARMAE
jgi:hypothetical protein